MNCGAIIVTDPSVFPTFAYSAVLFQAFSIELSKEELLNVSSESAREVVQMELTLSEFADALSMSSKSSFVTKVNISGSRS